MLFTIIIATYNAENFLEECLMSIINQSYQGYELLIIDGGSTDNTLKIIEKYKEKVSFYISEKDNGIYDAWNKGIVNAKGDWIMFVGADDLLKDKVLENYFKIVSNLNLTKVDFISGKIELAKSDLTKIRLWGNPWNYQEFRRKMNVAHTTSLHSSFFFKKYGLFDDTYKIAGDYEILLRPKDKLKTIFVEFTTGIQRIGGVSSNIRVLIEFRRIMLQRVGESFLLANFHFLKNVFKFYFIKAVSIFNR